MSDNKVRILFDTNPAILARAEQDRDITPPDRAGVQDVTVGAHHVIAPAVAQKAAIAQDSRLTEEGKQAAVAEIGEATAKALIPIRAKIRAALRAHQEFTDRAPYMERDERGFPVDTRQRHRKDDPVAALVEGQQDRLRLDFLLAKSPSDRGRLLRQIADSGSDSDGLLAAAKRAPSFLDIMDAQTRHHVTAAHLRQTGLDVALAQSAFAAARYAQIEAAISESLAGLGVSPEREPPIRL